MPVSGGASPVAAASVPIPRSVHPCRGQDGPQVTNEPLVAGRSESTDQPRVASSHGEESRDIVMRTAYVLVNFRDPNDSTQYYIINAQLLFWSKRPSRAWAPPQGGGDGETRPPQSRPSLTITPMGVAWKELT